MSEPHFQDRKMHWLLRVAGNPAIKPLALVAAVAMANRANSKTCVVNAKLSTLASDLARSDDTGLSRGAAQLVELGFLKAKKAGRKVIWTVDLNAAPAHPEQSPKAKGHVKNLRAKVAQARNDESCAPAQQSEGVVPDTDKAEQLRTCAAHSCAGAQFDEIQVVIPEGKRAYAPFPQSVIVETEDKTRAPTTIQNEDQDRALGSAVHHETDRDQNDTDRPLSVSTADRPKRPDSLIIETEAIFGVESTESEQVQIKVLLELIGRDAYAALLQQVDTSSNTPMLSDWLQSQPELDLSDMPPEEEADAV